MPQNTNQQMVDAIQHMLRSTRRKLDRQQLAVKQTEQLILAYEYQLEQLSKR